MQYIFNFKFYDTFCLVYECIALSYTCWTCYEPMTDKHQTVSLKHTQCGGLKENGYKGSDTIRRCGPVGEVAIFF